MEFSTTEILDKLMDRNHLSKEEAEFVMEECMEGRIPAAQMAAIMACLRSKKETVEEITSFVKVMREKSTKIPLKDYDMILDTCGTGGDKSGSFNISTAAAIILAAGGYKVAKHGNRSNSSKSGSADVLEALGININLTPEQVATCVEEVGIGFLFAPALHASMKYVVPIRKELKIRTIFNVLGPLTNPAGANVQVIGVFDKEWIDSLIHVLKGLGTRSAYVVSGLNGMDEVSISTDTKVARLFSTGRIDEYIFRPENYGFQKARMDDIKGGTPQENAEIIHKIFEGERSPKRKVAIMNAGFAVSAADECGLEDAFLKVEDILASKKPVEILENWKKLSNSF